MTRTAYNIWLTLYTSSAKNAAIVDSQHMRSRYVEGRLEYVPANDPRQQNYQIEAWRDDQAWEELDRQFRLRNPGNRKPLAGRSYMPSCRAKMRS